MTGEFSSVFKEAFEEATETADPWQLAIVNKKEHIDRPGWFTKNTDEEYAGVEIWETMRNESSFCLDFIFFLDVNYDICTHYQYHDQEAGSGMGCPYCQGTDKVYTSTKSSLNLYLHELVNYNYVIVSKVRDIRQEDMPRVCMWLRKQRDLHDARFVKIPPLR